MNTQTYNDLPTDVKQDIVNSLTLDESIPEGRVRVTMPAAQFVTMNRKARRAQAAMARRAK